MDVTSFLNRTNLSKADLLRKIGKDPKSSLISAYENGTSNPSFDVALKLLKAGMTPRELFGEEIDEILKAYYLNPKNPQVPERFDNENFREGVGEANKPMTREEVIQMVMKMKAEGKI